MWKPSLSGTDLPKYIALADRLEQDVRSGVVLPGDQLPTHRDLADALRVNVSTITRAYQEAERRGLISGTVGRGTFVSADACAVLDMLRPEGLQKDMIELGLVLPLYIEDGNPAQILKQLSRDGHLHPYMKYTEPAGLPEHRAAGAQWVQRFGLNVSPEQVVVTAGAQHALACCLLACFRPGDRIAVDPLTYPGFKSVAVMLGIRLVAIAADEHGMIPEALATACRRDEIKGIYLMPGVQNPTAVHMPLKRRKELADSILRHRLLLMEDEAFGHTCSKRTTALSALAPLNSIFIASLSKVLYAGLRCAFVVSEDRYRALLVRAILNTLWMVPPLNSAIVAESITSGFMEKTLAAKQKEAARRNALAAETLDGFQYRGMPSGYFIWMQLPESWRGPELEVRGRQLGMNLFSAEKFAVGGIAAPSAIRISLTGPASRAELAKGLESLAELLHRDYVPSPIL